ncbi:MAG: NADH-quinone oxidoreductase subunit M [bacterium]|jgi:NADH-quinone oxidoreductase subunit M|nr:Fe-S-binding domain-containing protein [Deltaproteobacteria bacterium]MCP4243563.1 NADH-quinone oxidoreductase subunit M [bacterium]MDP6073504.1 NADH-quinone oxidoreductase subunit M [Myxococcota bacterium]MDP6242852.1 NADH-quinone oxidoreductase subunit M [Myxococcota bacterium]MDP7076137.1 NADH-quinone oxidoreductase subunit M [Myxococcota bacterium]
MIELHLLSIVTFLPLLTGLALGVVSVVAHWFGAEGLPKQAWRGVALASTALTFGVSLQLFSAFDVSNPGYQFVEHAAWLPAWGIDYFVGIDGISLFLVLLTTFLMPIVLLASWNDITESVKSYVFFMLFLETGMLGAFVSLNLFQFYVFWEVMLIPMYFIIGIWGGSRRIYAAVKFFLFTMVGSLLMLVALLVVYVMTWEQTGALGFNLVVPPGADGPALLGTVIPVDDSTWWKNQNWLFAAFALAFAIKVPMVPFHTWLPDAHVEAPTAGSVVLAGVLLKMGTYGFLRFALPLFPDAAVAFTPAILALALVGILYGSLVAMVQADVKKLVAYSSVAHLGFVMLGMFSLNTIGLNGSVLQMVNHGLSTGALFLLVGMLYSRRHTRLIDEFGGVAKPMPVFAAFFGIATMSSIGLPALNGFVGEFLILLGTYLAFPLVAVIATSGVVLAAAYMLWMFRRVMFGPLENPENLGLLDLDWREKLVMVVMTIPIVWIGLFPEPFLRRIEPSVVELQRVIAERSVLAVTDEEPAKASGEDGP